MINPSRLHVIYYYLLHDCLYLSEEDYERINHSFPSADYEHVTESLIRSAPGSVLYSVKFKFTPPYFLLPFFDGLLMSLNYDWPFGVHHCARMFDYHLEHVPGFYHQSKDLAEYELDMVWRLNAPMDAILRPYFDERGRIMGIFLYRHPADTSPLLLSSSGLCLGAAARTPLPNTRRILL